MSTRPADRLIVGRYALLERLGSGGMGTVWRAEDHLLQREVAVKEIAVPAGLGDEARATFDARVAREARAVSRLSHPSAVTLFDQVSQDGRTFLVMELVDAPTLAAVVERDGPLAPSRAAQVGLDVLGALRAAHRAGMVHRDVKPSNILVPGDGAAKLTDFGVVAVQDDANVTSSGMVLGSPNYMAPEQATGSTVSAATDIWGLGATLHFAVEGHPPFERNSPVATVTAAVNDQLPPIRNAGPLGPVLEGMLAKDPASRLDEAEVERRLRAIANAAAVAAPVASTAAGDVTAADHTQIVPAVAEPAIPPQAVERAPVAGATAAAPLSRVAPPPRHRGWLTALVVVACLALIGAGTLWGMGRLQHRNGDVSAPAATGQAANGDKGSKADATDDGASVTVPAGWRTLTRDDAGFSVAYPADWTVSRSGSVTDLREPGTGTYLRLDWVPQATPSAVDAWRNQEASFRARYPDYQRVRLDPTTFHGSTNAAIWEYTYSDGGAQLHAIDIGFVSGGHGYAFNFQTHADRWDGARQLRQQLETGFRTPA